MANGAAVVNSYFGLANVGLYRDPLATGIAPPWVMPDYAEESRACQRYYAWYLPNHVLAFSAASGSYGMSVGYQFQTRMRIAPAMSIPGYSGNLLAAAPSLSSQIDGVQIAISSSAAGYCQAIMPNVIANARM